MSATPMPEHDTDLERMARDIGAFARLVGAACEPEVVARTLDIFRLGFQRCPVELRTTTLKQGQQRVEVSFRYIDSRGSHDPYQLALDSGALRPRGRPVDALVPELRRRFPIFGHGVDATATFGLEKIWPFVDRPRPLEEALSLTSLPPSVARSEPWLRRHGLDHFSVVAADYRHESANLYFLLEPGPGAPERLGRMIADLGVAAPGPEVLAYNARAAIAGVTYSWRKDTVERLCLYVPEPVAEQVPVTGDPLVRAVVSAAPTLARQRMFVVGSSFGPGGAYTKLEIDYTGTSVPLLQKWIDRHSRPRLTSSDRGADSP